MASDIHKKRTGKSFRITEDIVVKEEMYEEEDDDLPRSYKLLGPHMQTSSHEMNSKIDAYLSNKMAMAAYLAKSADDWRSNEINQLFAKSFPNAGLQAQQITQGMSNGGCGGQTPQTCLSPVSPSTTHHQDRHESITPGSTSIMSPTSTHSVDNTVTTQTPTPVSDVLSQACMTAGFSTSDFDASSDMDSNYSPFTTELPNDIKMMMSRGIDLNNPFAQVSYGHEWTNPGSYCADFNDYGKMDLKFEPHSGMNSGMSSELYPGDIDPSMKWEPTTRPAMDEPSWDSFIHDSAWSNDQ